MMIWAKVMWFESRVRRAPSFSNDNQSTRGASQCRNRHYANAPHVARDSTTPSCFDIFLRTISRCRSYQFRRVSSQYCSPISDGSDETLLKPISERGNRRKRSIIQQGKFAASDVMAHLTIHGTRTAIFAVPKRGNPILLQHWSNRESLSLRFISNCSRNPRNQSPTIRPLKHQPCSVHFRQSNLEAFAASPNNLLGFAIKSDIPIDTRLPNWCMRQLLGQTARRKSKVHSATSVPTQSE